MKKLKDVVLEPDEEMVFFDATALFTKVLIEESITIIRECLANDNTLKDRTFLSVDNITELLRCCVTTTYFVFKGVFYTQIEGAAMGFPVSPIVSNLFLETFESKALATFPHLAKFWGRYVDDTFIFIKLPSKSSSQHT